VSHCLSLFLVPCCRVLYLPSNQIALVLVDKDATAAATREGGEGGEGEDHKAKARFNLIQQQFQPGLTGIQIFGLTYSSVDVMRFNFAKIHVFKYITSSFMNQELLA
jgi:hypothetical protein